MLRFRHFLPVVIVLAILIAIAWIVARPGFVTQLSSTGASQANRSLNTTHKDGRQTADPDEGVRSNAVAAEPPQALPLPPGNHEVYDELNAKLAVVERRLDELTTIERKLNDLSNNIGVIRQMLGDRRAVPSAWSWLGFWLPTLVGLLTLSIVVALSISIRPRKRRADVVETGPPLDFDGAPTNATDLLLSNFRDQSDRADRIERTVAQLQTAIQELVAEIRKPPAEISNHAGLVETASAPFKPSYPVEAPRWNRPPAPPKFEDQAAAVLMDFNEMTAHDGTSFKFQERWRPQSVVMANFEQRVKESGFTPQLLVRSASIGSNDEHFWFIPFASSRGYIFPAKRLLQHRSALRGDGAAKLFRMIFEIIPAESFSVERPAYGQLDGGKVQVVQQGAIRLPQ